MAYVVADVFLEVLVRTGKCAVHGMWPLSCQLQGYVWGWGAGVA